MKKEDLIIGTWYKLHLVGDQFTEEYKGIGQYSSDFGWGVFCFDNLKPKICGESSACFWEQDIIKKIKPPTKSKPKSKNEKKAKR